MRCEPPSFSFVVQSWIVDTRTDTQGWEVARQARIYSRREHCKIIHGIWIGFKEIEII